MKEKVLFIAGRPGLYKLLSRGKNNLIVEALDATHKRQPTFGNDRITSLNDIAMYTNGDDVPLTQVLENLKTLEEARKPPSTPRRPAATSCANTLPRCFPTLTVSACT